MVMLLMTVGCSQCKVALCEQVATLIMYPFNMGVTKLRNTCQLIQSSKEGEQAVSSGLGLASSISHSLAITHNFGTINQQRLGVEY